MSQLDLATTAEVSARHVSFLETGRSKPSREMILKLAATLDVPFREQNAILHAAGFSPQFDAPDFTGLMSGPIGEAVDRMMAHHEPYPLTILDRHYNVLRMNKGADRMLAMFRPPSERPLNVCEIIFDPEGLRPVLQDWESTARALLERLHRELLHRPGDEGLALLISKLMAYPGVPASFRDRDYGTPSEPILSCRFDLAGQTLGFFTTLTVFQAPQNVTLEEILIESYFPLDETTAKFLDQVADPGE